MANISPIFLNNVYSTVQAGSSAIGSSSATGINVATGDGANFGSIGTNQYIPAVVVDTSTSPETVKEYVWITSIATDALTVTRQAEESTRYAASITTIQAGYVIAAVASAQELNDAWHGGGGDYFLSGFYSFGVIVTSALTTTSATLNRVYARPFLVPVRRSFDRIGMNVTTGGSAGAVARLGIYKPGPGAPGGLQVDAGTVGTTTTGSKEITISQSLSPGVWWLTLAVQGATCSFACLPSSFATPWDSEDTTVPSIASSRGYFQESVSGALPSTLTLTAGVSVPLIMLRAA